jgi:class 3 adenylate cyclase
MSDKHLILIVDDTPENLQVLNDILEDEYRVKVAPSGEKALKICSSDNPPDLVLLDVMMPGMDGYEVLRRMKADEKMKGIPVMFVTAMNEAEDETRGFELGAVDYVTKPIKPAVVLQRIRSHLELREAQKQLERLGLQYSSYLAPELASSIRSGEISTSVGNQRKKLTIFFSDIQGFTMQTEKLEPEDLSFLLNSYFEAMNQVIAEFGGTLDKYIGDAILVFFGDPHSSGYAEDAAACVDMALAMQDRILELREDWRRQGISDPLRVRMGVATGFCTVGNFGSSHKLDYTIIGSPVNLASRLESNAQPGTVLISEETWQLVGTRYECVGQAPLQVKGFHTPVRTWTVRPRSLDSGVQLELEHAHISIIPGKLSAEERDRVRDTIERLCAQLG